MALGLLKRFVVTTSWIIRDVLFLHSGKLTLLVAFGVGADAGDVMGLVLGVVAVLYTLSGTVCCHRKAVPKDQVVRVSGSYVCSYRMFVRVCAGFIGVSCLVFVFLLSLFIYCCHRCYCCCFF